MSSAILTASAKQAETAINLRISKIGTIKRQFEESCIGYSEKTNGQKAVIIFLVLIIGTVCIYAPTIAEVLLSLSKNNNTPELRIFGVVTLYAGCAYMFLYIINLIARQARISKINRYIDKVDSIEKKLANNIRAMSITNTYLNACIQKGAKNIEPCNGNIDEDIEKYESIADNFSKEVNGVLNGLLKASYWLSTIPLCVLFTIITGPWVTSWMNGVIENDLYSVIHFAYALLSLGSFIAVNAILFKTYHTFGIGSFLLTSISSVFSVPVLWLLYGIISILIGVVSWFVSLMTWVGIILFVIGAIFFWGAVN